jgi:DNA mismatch repair protein MLH3
MPVRVKQRAITAERQSGFIRDWDELKRTVVTLLLPWPGKITVTVRGADARQKFILRSRPRTLSSRPDISNICDILSQAFYIDVADSSSWVPLSASTSKLKINGAISLSPSVTKRVQFVSFGIHPLVTEGQNILHDEINRLFLSSAFGNENGTPDLESTDEMGGGMDNESKMEGYASKEPRGKRKAVDRWPMFYINIQQTGIPEPLDADDILDDKTNILLAITELLRATILEFLRTHDFEPKFTGRTAAQLPDAQPLSDKHSKEHLIHGAYISHPAPQVSVAAAKPEANIDQDILGSSIKPPSFSRSEHRLDSPLEAWSRVKKGSLNSKYGMPTGFGDMDIHRPSTAPLPGNLESRPISIRTSTPRMSQLAPLMSAAGDITRRPFGDVPADKPALGQLGGSNGNKEKEPSHDDQVVHWTNPMTKTTSLINAGTGLVTPTASSHKIRDSRLTPLMTTEQQVPLSSDPSPWLASVLNKWDNPVFQPTEAPIPKALSESQATRIYFNNDTCGNTCHNFQFDFNEAFEAVPLETSGQISKNALRNAKVISQVDKKFILVKLYPSDYNEGTSTDNQGVMLVIVDQHAADERVRVETLMQELCMQSDSRVSSDSGVQCIALDKPLSYVLSSKDIDLLRSYRQHFSSWGILYDLAPKGQSDHGTGRREESLVVRSLPPGIVERCKATPKLLIELIRSEIWKLHDRGVQPHDSMGQGAGSWVSKIRTCPQGIIDMLNSRACRSAIMFNDELSKEQCEAIVCRLADCAFPFQCAHGRPSLVPLVDLGSLGLFGAQEIGNVSGSF